MRITGVSVEGVGRFATGARVAGLGPGVNVLAAENEAGKSTLFRAVRACLFERHDSGKDTLRRLASEGLSLPASVILDFEHGGTAYRLAKKFLRSASASLSRGGVEIARGREADERTWELLGIDPGGGRSVDEAAFGILWVEQGKSFAVPEPSAAAASALSAAVHAEVGTLLGGERARTVLKALGRRARHPRHRRSQAEGRRPARRGHRPPRRPPRHARGDDGPPRRARRRADGARRQARRARPPGPIRPSTPRCAATSPRRAGFCARARRRATSSPSARRPSAAPAPSSTGSGAVTRRSPSAPPASTPTAGAPPRSPWPSHRCRPTSGAAQAAVTAERAALAALDAATAEGEAGERALQRVAAALARAGERDRLAERIGRLDALAARTAETADALAANAATAELAARLDETERALSVVAARLEAVAPQVEIALGPAAAGRVVVDGTPMTADQRRPALAPLTIAVGDLATVTVTPPAGAGAAELARQAELRRTLADVLAAAGVSDAAALRAARARRQALEANAAGLAAEAKAAGIGKGVAVRTALAAAGAEARDALAALEAVLAAAPLAEAGFDAWPTAEAVDARQDALAAAREATRRRRQTHEGTIEAHGATLARLADQRGRLSGGLAEIDARLAADLAALPDDGRAAALAAAAAAVRTAAEDHGTKAAALEAQRRAAPPAEEIERRQARVRRLEEALENAATRVAALDRDIANLEGRIESAGGDGLGERAAALEAEVALTGRERDRLQARADTLALLRDTVEACYAEQREQLNAPLRRHLRPYLNDLFPAADIALGDGFSVDALHRGGAAEAFQRLSDGTKEQIAVLVRLAMGAMLAERGEEVPIVLDDALVFSDDGRIAQMFDALNRAGHRQQVIVLTCRTRAFASLGGRMLTIEPTGPV